MKNANISSNITYDTIQYLLPIYVGVSMQLIAAKAALAALTQQMSVSELDTASEQPTTSRGMSHQLISTHQ